ncbi:5-deoxy-glucuronate isomerase [bacterium]|nr:5-deoxy-glucuronate isomerase [bacterium]
MLIKREKPFADGYNSIVEQKGQHAEMLMDFGILKMQKNHTMTNNDDKERAYLLIKGRVTFEWEGKRVEAYRSSCFDENPWVLHLPAEADVTVTCLSQEAELAVQKKDNCKRFQSKLFTQEECRSEQFGAGTMNETSTRTVRTVFDAANAPESNMVMGEVINHPGKWSSYPPHDHPQPEVYHFRFFPDKGFGYSGQGDEVVLVRNNDTVTILPFLTHPQVAAPGYAMYYIWMIPHLEKARFGPDSRNWLEEHNWVMDHKAKIWPDR